MSSNETNQHPGMQEEEKKKKAQQQQTLPHVLLVYLHKRITYTPMSRQTPLLWFQPECQKEKRTETVRLLNKFQVR